MFLLLVKIVGIGGTGYLTPTEFTVGLDSTTVTTDVDFSSCLRNSCKGYPTESPITIDGRHTYLLSQCESPSRRPATTKEFSSHRRILHG